MMQTMDHLAQTPGAALNSPAAARNAEAIRQCLSAHLPVRARVLEIASGSGQHAVHMARALPHIHWTPSDPSSEARASISAWSEQAGLDNLASPMAIDAMDRQTWPSEPVDAIACMNMVHISPWGATEGLMEMAERLLLRPGGLLYLYGPYLEADHDLAPSNAAFDDSLKARNPEWGLRQREDIEALARQHGLCLTLRQEMPANNLSLIFRRI